MSIGGIPDSVRQKFPHLQPLKRSPVLQTMNGLGTRMVGRRDYDQETQTYIKTRCFCFVYIPLFAIDAFRVGDAGERSWYFFGKESLSSFAKLWNMAILCGLLLGGLAIGWNIHTSSPEYRAHQEIARADKILKAGDPLPAASTYKQQIKGPADADARKGFQAAIDACLKSDKPTTAEGALHLVATLPPDVNRPSPLVPDAFQRGLALVQKLRATDPDSALDVLKEARGIDPKNPAALPLQIDLLKQAVAANPGNTNRAIQLALVYEENEQLDQSYKVLLPLKNKLGSTEGARILGQYLLQQGNYSDAYNLLLPYVQPRLLNLRQLEQGYTNAEARSYRSAIQNLERNGAEPSFYRDYKNATKAQQEAMVENYTEKWMRTDAGYQRALSALREASPIVHVTLDLGIVQLNRAQSLTDPTARKNELEAAEKTFLAIHGLAGQSDEYRLFLGQVYYWLGKSAQSKELFDQLLAANHRAPRILLALARTLREVGEEVQARALTEEAYRTATKSDDKLDAAALRSRLQTDIDDEITWLARCDQNQPGIQVELNSARGEKAFRDGNREQAETYFRKSIAGYEGLTKSAPTLNNCGLAYLNLYRISGNIADHNKGLSLLQEAVSLDPGNSLLLMNTTDLLLSRAYMDIVGDAIRFNTIRESPDQDMLEHLFRDEPERQEISQRLRNNDYLKKALTYLDKTLLLAPKNPNPYWLAASLESSFRDLPELKKLQQRLHVAAPDLSDITKSTRSYQIGQKDKERTAQLATQILRWEGMLDTPAVKSHPLTLEYVHTELIKVREEFGESGGTADSRKLLDEARALYTAHDDNATLACLINTSFFRASEELKLQNPTYARLHENTRRILHPRTLITFLIEHDKSLGPILRQNANVAKAIDLVKEHRRRLPTSRSVDDWALLRTISPDDAAQIAEQLKQDQIGRTADLIFFELNPALGGSVLEQYWTHKMFGDESGATKVYQQALASGVSLPAL